MPLPRVLIDDRRSSAAGTPGPVRIVTPSSPPPVPVVRTSALLVPGSCAVTRLLPPPPQPLPVVRSWDVPRARRAPASVHAATASTPIVRVPGPRVATLPASQPIAVAAHNVPDAPADLTRRSKRKSIGSDFASHADLEAAKQAREVEELIAIMPPRVASALLGGEPGLMQVPDPVDRAKTLADAVALKAGSDGASLANARRALEAFTKYADGLNLPDFGLPATSALVASFLRSEGQRAASGPGAQGGTTVANSRRVGLLWLAEKLGFPFEVNNIVAMGAANPGQLRAYRRADPSSRKRKQAGSLPIKAYTQFETLAALTEESPVRFFARSMVAFSLSQSVRAVDALRTVEDADEQSPDTVMSGYSYVSKDGEPMKTFAPAEGFLGKFEWWP